MRLGFGLGLGCQGLRTLYHGMLKHSSWIYTRALVPNRA